MSVSKATDVESSANALATEDHVRWPHGVALWCLIIASESVNGSFREIALKPWLGAALAKQVSFATATLLVLFIAWLFAPWLRATSTRAQLRVGAMWAILTFAFEAALAFGMGLSMAAFLASYDPRHGGLMLFGLSVLLLAPKIGAWLHSHYGVPGR